MYSRRLRGPRPNIRLASRIVPTRQRTSRQSILTRLPREIQLKILRELLRDACLQILPGPTNPFLARSYISNHLSTRLARMNREIFQLIGRPISRVSEMVENYAIDSQDCIQLQSILIDYYARSTRKTYFSDLDALESISAALRHDAVAEMSLRGINVQIIGHGIPYFEWTNNPEWVGTLENATQLTFSPTFSHKLNYTPVLQRLPSLKLIFIDPVLVGYVCNSVPFTPDALMAGVWLNKFAAHEKLRVMADEFMPRNFHADGVQDALIVRQIFWRAIGLEPRCLHTVFAKRVSSSKPGGPLARLVHCSIIGNDTDAWDHLLHVDDAAALLDVDIEDTTLLMRDPGTLSAGDLAELQQAYQAIAATPQEEHDYRPLLEHAAFMMNWYYVRGLIFGSVSLR